ncbi:MAG TPA: polysaccharide deacetylase [Thermoleophilaceae bacterium]|nr:polysaccharide deacetylase [Thermoleophilaceae bacterium]
MKFEWPNGARAACAITFDVDAESAILAIDRRYATRASTMSHQAYGPKVGVPRLMKVLERANVRATFFVPGFTAGRYPDTVRRIVDAGHEVGWHNDLHEPPYTLSETEERAILERGAEVLEPLTGRRPRGYRAPWWELNERTPELLAGAGFAYDSSLMDDDVPYRLSTSAGSLIELPVHWSLDDWEQYAFLPEPDIGSQIELPSKVLELWTAELDAMRDEGCLLVITMHPFLSGRPSRAAMVAEFLGRIRERGDVWHATAGEIADHADVTIAAGDARQLDVPRLSDSEPRR